MNDQEPAAPAGRLLTKYETKRKRKKQKKNKNLFIFLFPDFFVSFFLCRIAREVF
jgi:hypothetical protein